MQAVSLLCAPKRTIWRKPTLPKRPDKNFKMIQFFQTPDTFRFFHGNKVCFFDKIN